jgi:hypothetical protein
LDKVLLIVCFKFSLGGVLFAARHRDFADDLSLALTRSDYFYPMPDQAIQIGFASGLNRLETIHNPIGKGEASLVSDV